MGTLNAKFYTAGRLTQAAAELHFLPPILRTVARVKREDQDGVPVEEPPRRMLVFRRFNTIVRPKVTVISGN
jgi:hypothetical protein